MVLTIKTKIATGIGVLFSLLAIISVVALIAINLLSNKTENLLTANYKTIRYCNQMLHAMDNLQREKVAYRDFEEALRGQEQNITEAGEKEATAQVREYFEILKKDTANRNAEEIINNQLYAISQLNQRALEQKNRLALQTASSAKVWLSILITLVLVVGFSLAFNLPGIVAAPVKRLTDGIREISRGNYKTHIELDNQEDEFGQMAGAFNRMARRLDDWENSSMARLLFEKSRVDSIINQMEDAVLGTDAEGRVLFINSAAADLYNLNSDTIVGKPVQDVASHNDLLRTVTDGKSHGPLKIVLDGKEHFFTVAYKAVEVEGKFLGDVYTLKNVTHFKELDLSKTNLLATISHELKTPISSIKMSAKLLGDKRVGNMNEEQRDMVTSITEDTERLLRLTAELLNLTQIETGNIQLHLVCIAPSRVVAEAIAAVHMQAQAKKITIHQSIPQNLPLIQADADKTALVLVNLLSNAIKYSSEGATIELLLEQKKNAVLFIVKDKGEGIAPRYQSRIFDRYFKAPDSINKMGTGLGLAIAKELVEAQKGTIGVQSESGQGSTFYFELPIA